MKKLLLLLLLIPNLVMAEKITLACSDKSGFLMVMEIDLDKKTLFQKSTRIEFDKNIVNSGQVTDINKYWEILKWDNRFVIARQEGTFLGFQTEDLWKLNLDNLELRRTGFDIDSKLGIFSCLLI